jgi:tight adherence protein B
MIILGLTFVSVLAVVLGAFWLVIRRPETESRTRLRQRLETDGGTAEPASTSRLTRADWAGAAPASSALSVARVVTGPLRGALTSAGIDVDALRAAKLGALAAAVAILTLVAFGVHPGAAVGVTAVLCAAPVVVLRTRAAKRRQAFETQLPRAVDLMSRALRAGHGLPTAIAIVSEEIPEPLRNDFRLTYEQHNYGMPLPQALHAFAARVPLLDARFLVTAVLLQRETGGNLADVLDNLSTVMRDRVRVRRQMQVLTAQGRLTGWVLAVFPSALATLLWVWSPAQMNSMLHDPLGVRLLITAAGLQVTGAVIIRQILAVKY